MCGRQTAPGVGSIHDVIVDEGAGLQELQRSCSSECFGGVGATGPTPAPVAKCRTKTFSASEEIRDGPVHGEDLRTDVCEVVALTSEEAIDRHADTLAKVLDIERGRNGHGLSLWAGWNPCHFAPHGTTQSRLA